MRKIYSLVVALMGILSLVSCQKETTALLRGKAEFTTEQDFVVNYCPDGNIYKMQTIDLTVDSTGYYSFDIDLPEDEVDVEVVVNDHIYGAHLQKGKCTEVNLKQTGVNEFEVSYGGDNKDLTELVSMAASAYDLMAYTNMEGGDEAENAEFCKKLDAAHQAVMDKVNALKDQKEQDKYRALCEARYLGLKLRLKEDLDGIRDIDPKQDPEIMAMIETIDPNSDASVLSYNSLSWVSYNCKSEQDFKGDMLPYCQEEMRLVDENITNQKLRSTLCYCIGNTFFAYGDGKTNKEEFWKLFREFCKDNPDCIEHFQGEYDKVVKDITGEQIPDIQLTQPDGKKVSITSLQGKWTYVDCWATWCGPCCREIPHLEKLVERMKGDTQWQFVSFSMDTDLDAWHKKLDTDKPVWAQYVLDEDANKTLSEALNITGIPRFFILSPEGKVVEADTNRPSDENIDEHLKELSK